MMCLCQNFPLTMWMCLLALKFARWVYTWYMHFLMANTIAEWHRSDFQKRMKRAGIKPRWAPNPPRLLVLPSSWMVLSAVMLLMSRVNAADLLQVGTPVTWVEAYGGVRSIDKLPFSLPPPRKPPDPTPTIISPPVVETVSDREGEEDDQDHDAPDCACCSDLRQCPSATDVEDVLFCQFVQGSSDIAITHDYDDVTDHVATTTFACLRAFLADWPVSFGPLGLLSDYGPDETAIVDTGASLCITPHRTDFIDYEPVSGRVLKGLTRGTNVRGVGTVLWKTEVDGKVIDLKLRALHVPACDVRLLCPQQLRQEIPGITLIDVRKTAVRIEFPEGALDCALNESNLPTMRIMTDQKREAEHEALHACVMEEANQNLSPPEKELLRWHCKLGHIRLPQVQKIMRTGVLGNSPIIKSAASVNLKERDIKCASCAYSKAKRRASRPKTQRTDHEAVKPEKLLSKETLYPGQKVSMDHFVVSTPGRLFSSRGSEPVDRMYKGGVIFKDHASGHVYVEPVVNFTAGEAVRAKKAYEREMSSHGITIINYHTDNGVFTAAEFQDELLKLEQGITFSGVGAHHQNAVAEREIGTVFSLSRTQMLHAKLRWPKAVTAKLWPMVVKHTEYLLNHIPGDNNMCPMDILLKTTVPREPLRNLHVWGAPTYVLHPKLQDGGKIPKWEPRSRLGLHLGWSPLHASTVPLILNMTTGSVSPQFHVVFDDWFSTVSSEDVGPGDSIDEDVWTTIFVDHRYQATFDDDDPMDLDDEWLSDIERQERYERDKARVRRNIVPTTETPIDVPIPQQQAPTITAPTSNSPPVSQPPTAPPMQAPTEQPSAPAPAPAAPTPMPKQQSRRTPAKKERYVYEIDKVEHPTGPRRRPPAGRFKGMCAAMIALLGNDTLLTMARAAVATPAAHVAIAGFNAVTDTFDDVDFFSYQAVTTPKFKVKKGMDPDFPTYHQAMSRPDAELWQEAMNSEIETLESMKTWTVVPRSDAIAAGKKVIKSTWAFRQKRDPAGNPTKRKARFCVRGDLQSKYEEFESYSPVVQWSTVRLMLILSIVHGLETRQVDYVNAFAQADLDKDVFIEVPQGYKHDNAIDCVLKLNKSLYGMSDAPLMFFELLKKNLIDVGFKQLKHIDPCLFVHKKAICLTYVDDCLWFGKDGAALDALIDEMKTKMDLKVESRDVSAFLGIQFTRDGDTIELKQIGLIDKILAATGMENCTGKSTPAEEKTLGKDKNGKPFAENWNYPSVVGMLLYLSGNSRPDISFAVNQAARFTHDPRECHAVAIKRIVRYLQHTKDRGLRFKPSTDWKMDCYVDADFCGLWGSEDPDDPIVAKSRTGYIITLAGCPLIWKSTLQQETSVSTMMAEYVALSASMRELLPLKRLVTTIAKIVTGDDNVKINTLSDVFEDNMGALTVARTPRITPQSKFFAVKLHFFKEHVKTDDNPDGEIDIQKIDTNDQLADIMTKGLVEYKFKPLRDRLMGWDLVPATDGSNVRSRGSVTETGAAAQQSALAAAVTGSGTATANTGDARTARRRRQRRKRTAGG